MIVDPTNLDLLKAAKSRAGLARLLEIDLKVLTYLLYGQSTAEKYKQFPIRKRSGGERIIQAPHDELKSLQRRLATLLIVCVAEIQKDNSRYHFSSHGFELEKSIITNAALHRNKRFVLNLDLKDFFPTITAKRIRGFFIKDKNFLLEPKIATALAHIACADDRLPQGAPSSPVIANLIANVLDFHLVVLARRNGCTYTRYADDITFSTNKKSFPPEIAYQKDEHTWELGKTLVKAIEKADFEVNPSKTRMQYFWSRQQVTGLVVNKKINVPAEYRAKARIYVHALINTGEFFISRRLRSPDGTIESFQEPGTIEELHGILGFIHSIDNVHRTDVRKNPQNHPAEIFHSQVDKKLETYRRFLFFTKFYSNNNPLIICEGKTDNVYISNAAHQCKTIIPELIRLDSRGKEQLAFRMMKYDRRHKRKSSFYLSNFSTVSILGAGSGGVPNLINILKSYKAVLKKFRADGGPNPVIFVVDNDQEAKALFSTGVQLSFPKISSISGKEPFINLFSNVYLVPIPATGSIEELFDKKDIPLHIEGKKLVLSNDNDPSLAGKSDFAFKHVDVNANSLNWSGFVPLLVNIRDAFIHHWSKT